MILEYCNRRFVYDLLCTNTTWVTTTHFSNEDEIILGHLQNHLVMRIKIIVIVLLTDEKCGLVTAEVDNWIPETIKISRRL